MTNRPAPVFIFDLGGVLIDWNPRHLYRKLFDEDHEAMEAFLANVCTAEWNTQMDAGKSFAEGVAELVARFPEQAPLIQVFYTRWVEMISGPIEETVAILSALRAAGHELHALSNWSAETFPLVQPRFEFLDWFETRVISGEIEKVKPDADIFHHLLESIGHAASDCLFIDDSVANIETAEALGFQVHHFRSPQQLQEHLDAMGLAAVSRL